MYRFITTVVALIILLVLGYFSLKITQPSSSTSEKTRILPFEASTVDSVEIVQGNDSISIRRTGELQWEIFKPFQDLASYTKVMNLLVSVRAMMPTRSLGSIKDKSEYSLDNPELSIELNLNNRKNRSILIGSLTPDRKNRYVSVDGQLSTVSSQEVDGLFIDADSLRDSRLLRAVGEDINFLQITWSNDINLKFKRIDENWFFNDMFDNAPADRAVVEGIISGLMAYHALEFINEGDVSEENESVDANSISLSLLESNGEEHSIVIYNYHKNKIKVVSGERTVLVDPDILKLFPPEPMLYYDRVALRISSDLKRLTVFKPESELKLTARRTEDRRWLMESPEDFYHNKDIFSRRAAHCLSYLLILSSPAVVTVPSMKENSLDLKQELSAIMPDEGIELRMFRDPSEIGYIQVVVIDEKAAEKALGSGRVHFRNGWVYLMPEGLQKPFDELLHILTPND